MTKYGSVYYFAERKGEPRDGLVQLRQRVHLELERLAAIYNGAAAHVGYVSAAAENVGNAYGHCELYDEMAIHGYSPANPNVNVVARLTLPNNHCPKKVATLCTLLGDELNIGLVVSVPLVVAESGLLE